MYPGQTDFFLNQYEEAVKRPFGYLLIDLKTTNQDNCRLRTNVLPNEEGFYQAGFQENIPQEHLTYLKQQNLSPNPLSSSYAKDTGQHATSFPGFSPTRPYEARERPWLGLVTWSQNKINSEGGVLCLSIFLSGSFSPFTQ